jgi:Glycosyl transferase family 2
VDGEALSPPTLSVVVETWNADQEVPAKLRRLVAALEAQTLPFAEIEVVIAADETWAEELASVAGGHANVVVVPMRPTGLFSMNNAALERARGRFIAYLHSDVVPSPVWAETLVATLEEGADVAVGRTAYRPGTLVARTTSLFDFGHVQTGPNGRATHIISNSLALKRDVALRHRFADDAGSSGGCYLLSRQLNAAGCVVVYVADAFAAHDDDVSGFGFVSKRLRVGSDLVRLARVEGSRGLIREHRLLKLGPVAPFAVAAGRIAFDLERSVRYRRGLGLRIYELPLFALASVVMRGIELVGVAVEQARPGALSRRYHWSASVDES